MANVAILMEKWARLNYAFLSLIKEQLNTTLRRQRHRNWIQLDRSFT